MIALILAPSKGTAPFPPLAICALKAWLETNGYASITIDLNNRLHTSNRELYDNYNKYFGRPKTHLETEDPEKISNIDTIYNVRLLLHFLYPESYDTKELTDDELLFYTSLSNQLEYDAKMIIASGCKYVGFSTFISNVCYSLLLGQTIKRYDPTIVVFYGGASTAYEPIREFMLKSCIADYVLVGEGELAIERLVNDLEKGEAHYNTIYSENIAPNNLTSVEITVPIIKDIDVLPFPNFDDLNLEEYTLPYDKKYRFVSIATSRGCVNRCAYCSETQYWHRYRQRSVHRVVDEIEFLYEKYRARVFFFCDSLINGNIQWLNDFCNLIISRNIDILWMSYATLNNLNSELLDLMYKSGCVALTLGIEHVSSSVLKDVNKTSSMGNAKERLLECIRSGIYPIANIIYALPSENADDFLELLSFTSDPELINSVLFTFRPYEIRVGSVVTQRLLENSNAFYKHKISIPQELSHLMDCIDKLALFWLPDSAYIKQTQNKRKIITAFIKAYLIERMSNARRYYMPSILNRIIKYDSIPKRSDGDVFIGNGLQSFIMSTINNTNTVSDIICLVEGEIVNIRPDLDIDSIHQVVSKSVINNLIEISLKQGITWN